MKDSQKSAIADIENEFTHINEVNSKLLDALRAIRKTIDRGIPDYSGPADDAARDGWERAMEKIDHDFFWEIDELAKSAIIDAGEKP